MHAELYGSLAHTGAGHATDRAVLLGISGNEPASIDPDTIQATIDEIRATGKIQLAGKRVVELDEARDVVFNRAAMYPPGARTQHPNGLRLTAFDEHGAVLNERTFFSIGGGFITEETEGGEAQPVAKQDAGGELPYPFHSGAELLQAAEAHKLSIPELLMANECALRGESEAQVRAGVLRIWQTMRACMDRGIATEGMLPGGLNVRRRARRLAERLLEKEVEGKSSDPLAPLDWVTVYAMAVNEENAAGGRVVTAPTNGAAGVVPAIARLLRAVHSGAR